jgi:hypothetical protein
MILPYAGLTRENEKNWFKKLTKWGKIFYAIAIIATMLQIIKEKLNSDNERLLAGERNELKNEVKSLRDTITILKRIATSSSDTIRILYGGLNSLTNQSSSIERQVYITNEKVSVLGKTTDSMKQIMVESDRPIINLISAKINRSGFAKNEHIAFTFVNIGKRPATNLSGKVYGMTKDIVFKNAILPFSKSQIMTSNQALTSRMNLMFNLNPDSTSFDAPIYYYHKITYSDLITGITYNVEFGSKINPFTKGKYEPNLFLCSSSEIERMKKAIELEEIQLRKQDKFLYIFTPEDFKPKKE